MDRGEVLVELRGVTKNYQALRPLRVESLQLRAGESVALLGFDAAMAEVLVNLITAANLPDSGEVIVFGRRTSDITHADDWVATLDRFGLISERAVLVDQFTVQQNLAMPLSLEINDMPAPLAAQVRQIADEVALPSENLSAMTASISHSDRLRLRLGRALALRPSVLLAEHPNALIPREDAPAFAVDFARITHQRGLAALVVTADRTFAAAVADQVLTLQPATGELKPSTGWRRWF